MRQLRFLCKWFNFTLIFVLTAFYLSLAGSTVLAQGITLTLTRVQPDQAANDVDTPFEIAGSGFLNDNGFQEDKQ